MSDNVAAVGDGDFEAEVLRAELPVLVDFWGEWCGPCKAMAPVLERFAAEHAGRVKVVKVEMDKNQKTAMAWCVRSAPTLLLFRNGAVQATHLGMASQSQLVQLVNAAL